MKLTLKHALAAIVLVLNFATPVMAGPITDALDAYLRDDYATALRLWVPLANQGEGSSQFGLGMLYENGQGVPQDYAEAVKWYRKAADQGYSSAQLHLGHMY